jgi:hypothetical protein
MSGTKRGKQGTSTSGITKSPDRRKLEAKRLRRQEERWAAKSSEVSARPIEDLSPEERARLGLFSPFEQRCH